LQTYPTNQPGVHAGPVKKEKMELTGTHTHWEEIMIVLPSKHYSGHCKAIEEDGDQRTRGK